MNATESQWEIGDIDEVAQEVHINTGPDKDLAVPGKWLSMAIFYGDEDKPALGIQKALANARLAISAGQLLTLSEKWLDDQISNREFADSLRAEISKIRQKS